MKIDRLLGIVTILLQQDKVTAPELAKKFEVSRRTIHRDIDDICKAGIPIITYQGGDGGISIAEGYKLDKSVLSIEELQNIITGLKSLGSVSDTPRIERLILKLSPKSEGVISIKDSILIDLSSHYKSSLSEKISLLKSAISEKMLVNFDYYSEKGLSNRIIEPYFITFKWTSWYVFGYCRDRNGFRLFKLNRLWRHKVLNEIFVPREILAQEFDLDDYFADQAEAIMKVAITAVIATIDQNGFPRASTISNLKTEGIKHAWFATGLSTGKARCIRLNNKAGLCYCDGNNNVTLMGTIEILTEPKIKKDMWIDWFIHHFPGGRLIQSTVY